MNILVDYDKFIGLNEKENEPHAEGYNNYSNKKNGKAP